MIDPALARKSPEAVRAALKARGGRYVPAFDEWLGVDTEHRRVLGEAEALRARRNALSQEVGKVKAAKDEAKAKTLIAEVTEIKEKLAHAEQGLGELADKCRQALLGLPNLPHPSVPPGRLEEDNPVIRSSGEPPRLDFKALDHQTLGERLGLLDFAAAAKLAGSRFALWKGAGARLLRALIEFQLELHVAKHGYTEIWPPCLVRPEMLEGTGQLPKFEEDLYRTTNTERNKANTLYLIPTAEVPLTNLVRDEIVANDQLPLKLTAYTPCFRQEAGSYGKDVRGVLRNHQFDKVELVWITRPEDSLDALERMTAHAEAVLRELGVPYRVVEHVPPDLGFAARKSYDLEVWLPSEKRYREISSCSDCGDFQARRMNARFRRDAKSPPELVHTLNGSGVAVGRLAAALLENGQQEDGSVRLPQALQPRFGGDAIRGG